MPSEAGAQTQTAVRFSRVMRLRWVVALGASISVGLGVFTLLGQYAQLAGRQELVGPYLLMILMAVPLILTYAERGSVISGSGGAYNLARYSGSVWLSFGAGWLLLSGYASLMALLGWGMALHFNLITENFFDLSLDLIPLTAAVIGLTALYNILGRSWSWKTRSTYVFASIVLLLLIILRDIIRPAPPESETSLLFYSRSIMVVATFMLSSLWGLQFILNVRDEIPRPTRTVPQALFLAIGIGGGLGALAGLALFRFGGTPASLTPLVDTIGEVGLISRETLIILYAIFGFFINLIALNQGFVHSLRLIGDMTRDGFIPARVQRVSTKYEAPIIPLTLLAVVSILLVSFLSILTVVGLAVLTLMWVTALVHGPEAFQAKPNLPENRPFKLPFHPLFPWLTIAIAIFLPVGLDLEVWVFGLVWIMIGAIFYLSYARQAGLEMRRRKLVVSEPGTGELRTDPGYVVLVGIANPKSAPSLLRVGAKLAGARNGRLFALRVLSLPEQITPHLKRQAAEQELNSLENLVRQAGVDGVPVNPLVRLAPNPTAGILEAIKEERADLLLLGWEGKDPPGDTPPDPILDPILKRAPCDVAVLHGHFPQTVTRVLVPTAGGPHAPVALKLGLALTNPDERHVLVENMVVDPLTQELEIEAKANLRTTLDILKNGDRVEERILQVDRVKEGLVDEAGRADLLLIGASKEDALDRAFFGGLPVEVAEKTLTPTILVRKDEPVHQWWRRALEILSDYLPTLTVARQAQVYVQMRESAQPSVDFFVLIALAATIAILGLLQNSAAVIIGAMLVAPLMSPILAMAMAIVQGNLRLLLVAAEATAKGIALAIIVGIAVTIISPLNNPANEIMARTEPNLLDLMVALASGAAAGYAISRKEVAAALPGVAIAAALVPPLCVIGYGIGVSDLSIATGSSLLFATNLIAIILAAAVVFMAVGFHPPRAERGEVMRGLKVTVTLLVPIALVLGVTTIVSTIQLNQQAEVQRIFNNEVVTRAFEVREFTIERDRAHGGFVINATFIDDPKRGLTTSQIATMQKELTEAVGGPVTINATVITGVKEEYTEGFDRLRQLELLFESRMTDLGASVIVSKVDESEGGFTITAAVVSLAGEISESELLEIQAELSQRMEAAVIIEATIMTGTQINLEPLAVPTLTPTPGP
jgi:uncharacterized hydrophobic protein (TIGR00271 family)